MTVKIVMFMRQALICCRYNNDVYFQKIIYIKYFCGQALVQFSDADTAASARSALNGRSIPRWLRISSIIYQVKCVFATVAINLEFEDAAMEMKSFLTLISDWHFLCSILGIYIFASITCISCHMRISFSAHTNLNVTFQSHPSM